MPSELKQRISELEREIEELESSLPAHSVPASMLIRLEDMQEELDTLKASSDLVD